MRTQLKLMSALVLLLVAVAVPALADGTVGVVGAPAPGFTLKALDGSEHSLADYAGKAVVLEWINPNCPFSNRHAEEKTMTTVAGKHQEVVWLGINSTNPDSRDYLTPAAHQKWAEKNGIHYAILYDPTGEVGHAYGARTTPHMFIIDEQGKIEYNGAIDDDPAGRKAMAQRTNYVDGGLSEHEHSEPVDPATTKPYGCSVKY
jgi:peroxiredoxin